MNALERNLLVVKGLKPESLWRYFAELSTLPRQSGQEGEAVKLVTSAARNLGLDVASDTSGNTVVRVPATVGFEQVPRRCLQSHLDMVCVKRLDSSHNFATDPIEFILEDGRLRAGGTTLGADNGLGVGR